MYRATLIFLYPFSLSGYYTYFLVSHTLVSTGLWVFSAFSDYLYPSCRCAVGIFLPFGLSIPFLPLRCGYFPAFWALHTLPATVPWVFPAFSALHTLSATAPWVFSCLLSPPYPSCRCTVGIFRLFRLSVPFLPLHRGYFPAFPALHTLPPLGLWVFSCLFGSPYPRNADILCMLFSYNT